MYTGHTLKTSQLSPVSTKAQSPVSTKAQSPDLEKDGGGDRPSWEGDPIDAKLHLYGLVWS